MTARNFPLERAKLAFQRARMELRYAVERRDRLLANADSVPEQEQWRARHDVDCLAIEMELAHLAVDELQPTSTDPAPEN